MIRSKKAVERAKTVLIVFLTACFLALGVVTGLFSQLFGPTPLAGAIMESLKSVGANPADGSEAYTAGADAAASPFCIAVTWEDGSRYGVKYGGRRVPELFELFSPVLGEALGSSGEPEEITLDDWEAALGAGGVFFDYLNEQSLAAVATWLGTSISSGAASHAARRVCLAEAGGELELFYINAADGAAYRCSTKLDARALSSRAAALSPNGARFVFEEEGYPLIDRCTLLLSADILELELPEAKNPFRFGLSPDDILAAFDMNKNVASSYPETDGSVVYVEGGSTLRVGLNNGVAVFRRSQEEGQADTEDAELTDVIAAAYSFARKSAGGYCGSAELRLGYAYFEPGEDVFKVGFDYVFDGVPIIPRGAVTLEMRGALVVYAQVWFREYGYSDNTAAAMREAQALAAAQAKGGGEPILVYDDGGDGVLPKWIIR